MDYNEIQSLIGEGIAFMSDGDGFFDVKRGGGVKIENGKEVSTPVERFRVYGLCREVAFRDIDGDTIRAGDKRGIFNVEHDIMTGDVITIDGEAFRVVNPRPVRPTGTTVAYRPILRRVATVG